MAAQELLEQAYLYAFPLVLMDATRKVSTHPETPNSTRAPINHFSHAEKLASAHGLCKINPDIKEANPHEDDPQKLSFHFSGCGVRLSRQKRTPNGMKSWIFPTGGNLTMQHVACWTIRKAGSSTTMTEQRHGICKAMGIWTVMRRIRSTRACGGIPSSMPKPVCLKYVTASIRCVALIWPMRPSSAPTTAGSFLMS